ncbi:unnamed protein product, partial [Urochloa humidicola]
SPYHRHSREPETTASSGEVGRALEQRRSEVSRATQSSTSHEQSRAERMSCLGRAAVPVRRVWRGLSARLRRRRATGLGRLRKDVRTCEYSDVHVMWEMLSSTSNGDAMGGGGGGGAMAAAAAGRGGGKGSRRGSRVGRKAAVTWSRLAAYCCAL